MDTHYVLNLNLPNYVQASLCLEENADHEVSVASSLLRDFEGSVDK